MALRDHSLDEKITAAAREEFLEKGYSGSSLRKIAEKAGVTVGAIQTRYASKDELFKSLLTPLLEDTQKTFKSIKADYYFEAGKDFLQGLEESMRHESKAILHLIFEHWEEALLLFCRSSGSSLESFFDSVVKNKIEESVLFFRRAGYDGVDEKLLGLLISVQFDGYRRIVAGCSDKAAAEKYINDLMTYNFGGWVALFNSKDQIREDM